MGMFDHIKVEYPLQSLPQDLIDLWQGDIIFQTKDTPDQYMSLYKIDEDGKLWYEECEKEWVESKTPDSDSFMARLGHMNILSRTWKQIDFNGTINFYDGYNHKDYKFEFDSGENKEWQRYEMGWIEYCALFKDGQMISINLVRDDKPVKLIDEELEAKRIVWAKQRDEIQKRGRENRIKHPSTEQKLIDNINREVDLTKSMMDESDLTAALNNISILIKNYRKTVDIWYE